MARGSLRRFDVQAKYAIVLSALSALGCIAGIFLFFRNFDPVTNRVLFRKDSLFLMTFALAVVVSMLLGAAAVALGVNSAGQRRNEAQGKSWAGFFMGGLAVAIDFILIYAMYQLRFEIIPEA